MTDNKIILKNRIEQLDYLKAIFITLMVLFHLVYIGDSYPYAKQFVYTFHMPGFLLISGYVFNTNKGYKQFAKSMFWLFIPYIIMESGYIVMASVLPIREHIHHLTPDLFLHLLLHNPLGPYWYLQTLIICGSVYYLVEKHVGFNPLLILLIIYFIPDVRFANALYFMAGAIIRKNKINFVSFFQPTWLATIAIILITSKRELLSSGSITGAATLYLITSLLLKIYPHIAANIKTYILFIGRNTLTILFFSPLFTALSHSYQHLLMFDKSGMTFALLTLMLTIAGSLAIAGAMDKMHLSKWFVGKDMIQ